MSIVDRDEEETFEGNKQDKICSNVYNDGTFRERFVERFEIVGKSIIFLFYVSFVNNDQSNV